MRKTIIASDDYIRGLIDGEGCFTFCNAPDLKSPSGKSQIPTFVLQMHERDKILVEIVRNKLAPRNKVYIYKMLGMRTHTSRVYKRGPMARVMVRDIGSLKNKVVPFFYNKLVGYKGIQFNKWLEKIGNDPLVPERYKILYRLHMAGYWERNPNPVL